MRGVRENKEKVYVDSYRDGQKWWVFHRHIVMTQESEIQGRETQTAVGERIAVRFSKMRPCHRRVLISPSPRTHFSQVKTRGCDMR